MLPKSLLRNFCIHQYQWLTGIHSLAAPLPLVQIARGLPAPLCFAIPSTFSIFSCSSPRQGICRWFHPWRSPIFACCSSTHVSALDKYSRISDTGIYAPLWLHRISARLSTLILLSCNSGRKIQPSYARTRDKTVYRLVCIPTSQKSLDLSANFVLLYKN